MRRQKDQYLTVHINMDKDYASRLDAMAARLGVETRTQVFEAGLISLANQMGINDLPDRLPNPARKCYTRFLCNTSQEIATQTV